MRTRRRRRHGRRAGKKKNLSRRALQLKRRRSSLKKRRAQHGQTTSGQIQAPAQDNTVHVLEITGGGTTARYERACNGQLVFVGQFTTATGEPIPSAYPSP